MEDSMADPVAKERPATGKTKPARRTRYEDDLYTWVSEQVDLLRAGRLDQIDAENVAEELSDGGAEQYDKLESALEVLLMHMLKWDHQPERRNLNWCLTIQEQRLRAAKQLRKYRGLKSRIRPKPSKTVSGLWRWRTSRETKVAGGSTPGVLPLTIGMRSCTASSYPTDRKEKPVSIYNRKPGDKKEAPTVPGKRSIAGMPAGDRAEARPRGHLRLRPSDPDVGQGAPARAAAQAQPCRTSWSSCAAMPI